MRDRVYKGLLDRIIHSSLTPCLLTKLIYRVNMLAEKCIKNAKIKRVGKKNFLNTVPFRVKH